jgi:hypothetical protein
MERRVSAVGLFDMYLECPVIEKLVLYDPKRLSNWIGIVTPGLRAPPAGSADDRRYRYWPHYADGSAMSPLFLGLMASRLAGHGFYRRRDGSGHTALMEYASFD